MMLLPVRFLEWNYFPRGKVLHEMANKPAVGDMNRFLLNSVRHNPALCTACCKDDGSVFLNAKIVGIGYVVREGLVENTVRAFAEHIERGDAVFENARTKEEKEKASNEYQKRGAGLLVEQLYFEGLEEAERHIDFSKMATIELALNKPNSSRHTWLIVQRNQSAVLLFYQPPMVSFEIRGNIEIHEGDAYHKLVNLVHDAFHYAPPERRASGNKPVYIFKVQEVYDNSASMEGFGTKLA